MLWHDGIVVADPAALCYTLSHMFTLSRPHRAKMLWHDGIVVTDPAALAQICGRGEGACDKASYFYHAIDGVSLSTFTGMHLCLLSVLLVFEWRGGAGLSAALAKGRAPVIRPPTSTSTTPLMG